MNKADQQCVNLNKPEELTYWSAVLNVAPSHLMYAIKATGSNMLHRLIWFLKAEGLLPPHFDVGNAKV